MNLAKSWTITSKDFAVFRRKKSVIYGLVAFPLGTALGFPAILALVVAKRSVSYAELIPLMDSFAFFFVLNTVVLSTSLASYSIVGEKVEKSLEPLLATPTSDSEILLGKVLAAFLPTVAATLLGAAVFMALVDAESVRGLGYLLYPNWTIAVLLLLTTPLAGLLSTEVNVIISARATDVRAAQQFGVIVALPLAALYVAGEIHLLTLDTPTLLEISAVLAALDLLLFFVSRATFHREAILTKWK
jgi:ABC-2 type transport system permease protein